MCVYYAPQVAEYAVHKKNVKNWVCENTMCINLTLSNASCENSDYCKAAKQNED